MGTPGYVGGKHVLYKPQGQKGQVVVMMPPSRKGYKGVRITTPDGKTYDMATRHTVGEANEWKYYLPGNTVIPAGSKITASTDSGDYDIGEISGTDAQLYEPDSAKLGTDPDFYDKNAEGAGGAGGDLMGGLGGDINDFSGAPNRFKPGHVGYGFFPAYMGKYFPTPYESSYTDIDRAPYNFTDPIQFSEVYGKFARSQYAENAGFAKDLALDALDTELRGNMGYIPAMAALQRDQVSLDNIFNQAERTRQVRQVLPGAEKFLKDQETRAATYAQGRLPDEQGNTALELGIRSRAADRAIATGIGGTSAAATKASELMSAEDRFKISQYGDQLGAQNIQNQAALLMAPTEYANAGNQIQVMPRVSGAELQMKYLSDVNQYSMLTAPQAMESVVQQNQYVTSLEQQNRQFNATNRLQNDQFNTTTKNEFAMQRFQYDVGYAGIVAGAAQTNINTLLGLEQQKMYADLFNQSLKDSQGAGTLAALGSFASSIMSFILGLGLLSQLGGSTKKPDKGDAKDDTSDDSKNDGKNDGAPSGGAGDTSADAGAGGESVGAGEKSATLNRSFTGANAFSSTNIPQFTLASSPLTTGTKSALESIGVPSTTPINQQTLNEASQATSQMMRSAGLSTAPSKDSVASGVNAQGQIIYSNSALANLQTTDTAVAPVYQAKAAFKTLAQTGKADQSFIDKIDLSFDNIINRAQDATFLAGLGEKVQSGDEKGFIAAVLNYATGKTLDVPGKITDDFQGQQGIKGAMMAAALFTNWNNMSTGQKAIALTKIGVAGLNAASGTNLWREIIPGTTRAGELELLKELQDGTREVYPRDVKIKMMDDLKQSVEQNSLTYGQAFDLMVAGYDVYNLVRNWNDYSAAGKAIYGTSTAVEAAKALYNQGFVSKATVKDAAVAGYNYLTGQTATTAASQGTTAATTAATQGTSAAVQSAGYTQQGIHAMASAEPGAFSTTGAAINTIGYGAIAAGGAYQIYQNWGKKGADSAFSTAMGGGAVAYGAIMAYGSQGGALTFAQALGASGGPVTMTAASAAIVAMTLASQYGGSKKSGDQSRRDGVRANLQTSGVIDDNYDVTLADGTKVNVGLDGKRADLTHGFTNSQYVLYEHSKWKGLSDYEIDYTNDLDYATSMSGLTLSRLINGGSAKNVDQLGAQMTNAALKTVGYGQEMSKGNFDTTMNNMRAMWAKAGISNKESAIGLLNKALEEGRISQADYVAGVQGIDMTFNPTGYGTAKKITPGRWQGLSARMVGYTEETDAEGYYDAQAAREAERAKVDGAQGFGMQSDEGVYGGSAADRLRRWKSLKERKEAGKEAYYADKPQFGTGYTRPGSSDTGSGASGAGAGEGGGGSSGREIGRGQGPRPIRRPRGMSEGALESLPSLGRTGGSSGSMSGATATSDKPTEQTFRSSKAAKNKARYGGVSLFGGGD